MASMCFDEQKVLEYMEKAARHDVIVEQIKALLIVSTYGVDKDQLAAIIGFKFPAKNTEDKSLC